MLKVPQKTLENIKKILTKEKSEVNKNLKEVDKDDPATSPSLVESSEPGTDSWIADSHTRALAFKQHLKNLAESIKKALSKIKNRTYGQCEKCGKSIEPGRLLAMPTTTLCLSCSKKR